MRVISTATTLSHAFRNAGRVSEILGVLGRHGFADLVHRMRLSRFLPSKYLEKPGYQQLPVAARLRKSFEELGPTFVKLGQLMATRPDLIPENFITEFEKLQDKVPPVNVEDIQKSIESELGQPLSSLFAEFHREPMAAASIAQVHEAVLKTGEKVAVKVQRPGINRLIQNDISILRGMAALLEQYIPESKIVNPTGLVEEFFKAMLFELDFGVEANNIRRIKKNLASLPKIAIPEVYSDLSTGRVLTLEKFSGIRFSDREAVVQAGIKPMEVVEAGADAFFHMVMQDGLFHADLHAGNLFVLPDGRIGLVDFGIVGRLSRRVRDSVISIFTALVDEDFESVAAEYVDLCPSAGHTDIGELQKELMDTISPYMGMSLGKINVGKLLMRSTSIATRHQLQVPRELMLLFKAIVSIEALGKKLEPNFDILQVGTRQARQILTTRYSKERILRDLVVIGRDLQNLAERVPGVLRRFLRVWTQNGFVFETKNEDIASVNRSLRQFTYFLVLSVFTLNLTAIGVTCLVLGKGPHVLGTPIWSIISFGTVVYLLGHGLWSLRKWRQ